MEGTLHQPLDQVDHHIGEIPIKDSTPAVLGWKIAHHVHWADQTHLFFLGGYPKKNPTTFVLRVKLPMTLAISGD